MPTYTYTGDEPRFFGGDINRELQPGDTVDADTNPDPGRFTGGDDLEVFGTEPVADTEQTDADPVADTEQTEE